MSTYTVKRRELPVQHPQRLIVGADFKSDSFRLKNPDGSSQDLTGATWAISVRDEPNAAGTLVFSPAAVVVNTAGTPDGFYFELTDEQTTTVTDQRLFWSATLTDALGKKTTYFAGVMEVERTA